jgi:hypothetical protein
MPVQTAIRVSLPNRPDELARTSKWLAQAGVNIDAISAVTRGEEGFLEMLVDNPVRAAQTLKEADIRFQEVQVALTWLPDRPGSLARATEALSRAGVNIESSYLVRTEGGRVLVAFGSSQAEQADKALQAIRWDEEQGYKPSTGPAPDL